MAGKVILSATFLVALLTFVSYSRAETSRERAERLLDQMASIEFVDTPLKDVCAYLSEQHGVKIRVSNQEERLYPDIPITSNYRGISLRSALNLMLDQRMCDYRVTDDGEIVVIDATPESKSRRPITKVQDAGAWRNFQKLEKTEATLEFVDTPFKDVLAFVADNADVTIAVDWEATEAVGLEPDTPISKNIPKTKLYRAMTGLLFPYNLRVALRNEVLYITSRDDRIPRREIAAEFHRLALQPVKLDLQNPPLIEALSALADQANCTIICDHRRMDNAKISCDMPVVGPLRQMPLRDAFAKILHPIGLRAMVYDDVLFVTPLAAPKPK